MKKSLFILLFILVSLTFSSCSKDASINRKIDGEWNTVTIDGDPLDDAGWVFKFNKDKKSSGLGSMNHTVGTSTNVYPFTYSVEDEKIICVPWGIYSILTIEKNKLELIDSDNSLWVLERI
jgi:hypothetical protein